LPEIKDFLKLSNHVEELEDHQWFLDLSFLTDVIAKLQVNETHVVIMISLMNTFKTNYS